MQRHPSQLTNHQRAPIALAPLHTRVLTYEAIHRGLRLGLYLILTLAAFETMVASVIGNPAPGVWFREVGPWEWGQFALVATSAALLWINAVRHPLYAPLFELCGLIAFCAAIRELDFLFDQFVFDGAYKGVIGLLLASCLYIAWTHSQQLAGTLVAFMQTAHFYFFFAAVLVVFYAELIGQVNLWTALMGEDYHRSIKRAVEELAETMGYLLLFFGAVETCFARTDH